MTLSVAVWRRAFVAASVVWALVLPAAPLAAAQSSGWRACYAFAFLVYAIGSRICHQLPARSFHVWSTQMPVCARCTGIYVGAALGAMATLFQRNVRLTAAAKATTVRRCSMRSWKLDAAALLAVVAIPTAVTLGVEWSTGIMTANWIRALSGIPLGAAVVFVVVQACDSDVPRAR